MSFNPRFSAGFIEGIAANLLSAVTANQTQALAWANGDASSFQSRFSAGFIEKPVANLLAQVSANITDALAWANNEAMLNDDGDLVRNDDGDLVLVG